ncbi:MAG: hypothetical protein ABJC12_06955 [Saprospiraceae bacterium]
MKPYILICSLFFVSFSSISKLNGQIKYSISGNFIYSIKWHRDSFFAYYFDVSKNYSGSIQADAVYPIGSLLFRKTDGDILSIGLSSEFSYLPFSGLHYVDNAYLGKINGLDQWLHHYDHDRYRFVYMISGIKVKYEIKNAGFVSLIKGYPFTLHQSSQTQDLFINNKTGAFSYGTWETGSLERARNPHLFTELMIGIEMNEHQYFILGVQWFARSSIYLIHTPRHVDSREQAFRNVKIGWQLSL